MTSSWRKPRLGLRGKLILFILVIGTVPIVVGLSVVYIKGTAELQAVIGGSFEALAKDGTLKLDGEIHREINIIRQVAKQIASDPGLRNSLENLEKGEGPLSERPAPPTWPRFGEMEYAREALTASWVTGPDPRAGGNKERKSNDPTGLPNSVVSGFRQGSTEDIRTFEISTPIKHPVEQRVVGWLHRTYDAKKFFDPLIFPIRFGETGHVMIIDNLGTVISCPLLPTGSRIADQPLIAQVTGPNAGWVQASSDGHGGQKISLIGHAPLVGVNRYLSGGVSWHAFAWQASHEVFAPAKSLQVGVLLAAVLAIGLLGIFGYYASSGIVNPIRRLREEAARIANGDLDRTLDIQTHDEIEELADQFNEMRIQLRHLITTLEEKVKERTKSLEDTQAEKDRIVDRLIQTQKLAAMGTMVSGIAHEINNPLYIIMGMAETIRDEEDLSQCKIHVNDIIKYTKHIADIVTNLAGYVRPTLDHDLEDVDLNAALEDAVLMAKRSLLCDKLEIKESLRPVPKIYARPEEIQQAFFNIIRNGIQAMKGTGTLGLESYQKGDQVGVRIRDTGPGISRENIGMIFDPFFTTKGPDEGTGLGLYIVHQIVTKYGGTVTVESWPGHRTVFTIQFPAGEKNQKEASL